VWYIVVQEECTRREHTSEGNRLWAIGEILESVVVLAALEWKHLTVSNKAKQQAA